MSSIISLFSDNKPKLIAWLVIFVSCWGIYHAVRMGAADIVAYKARYELKKWSKSGNLPTPDELAFALEKASSALDWQPRNPEHLNLKAMILIYKGMTHLDDGQFSAITNESVSLYQLSTELRPKWPLTWSHLALLKAYRGEFDAVYLQAIANAVKFGPWEPGVHIAVGEAGMAGWSDLDKATRRHVSANIQRGLRFSPKELRAIANRYQLMARICLSFPKDKFTNKFCA